MFLCDGSMSSRKNRRSVAFVALAAGLTLSAPAYALQPLAAFVESAQKNNPDNREAEAVARQRAAERRIAMAPYLPTLTVQGTYAYNQYESAFTLPPDGPTVVIAPHNALDAYFTLAAPVVNANAWMQDRAAQIVAKQAAAAQKSTAVSIESNVTQSYYQLLGSEAVQFAASKSAEVAEANLKLVRDRQGLGTASDLDVQRATADVARARQDSATADQGVINARRDLESLSRLTPEPGGRENYIEDDLHDETPLSAWLNSETSDLVTVQPAILSTQAAKATRDAARAAWAPTLTAQAQEHVTNAAGFTGQSSIFTFTLNALWRLDFSIAPQVAAKTAAVHAAEAREDKARRAADDAIYQAWHMTRVNIEKARAARAQVKAATLAQDLARERYKNGVATQLEVVQAQRDFFSAAVSQVQADFNLQYSRALLRLVSRHSGEKNR